MLTALSSVISFHDIREMSSFYVHIWIWFYIYLISLHTILRNTNDLSTDFLWVIDRTQTGTGTVCQRGTGSNSNVGVLHTHQISKTAPLLSDAI